MDPITQTIRDSIDMLKGSLDLQNIMILFAAMVIGITISKLGSAVWKWCFSSKPEVPMKQYVRQVISLLDNHTDQWSIGQGDFGARCSYVSLSTINRGNVSCYVGYDEHGDFYLSLNGDRMENELTRREKKVLVASATNMFARQKDRALHNKCVEATTTAEKLYNNYNQHFDYT